MKLKDIEGLDEASVYVEVDGVLLSIGTSYQKIKGTTAQVVLVPSKPRAPRVRTATSPVDKGTQIELDKYLERTQGEVTGGITDASA